MKDLIFYLFKSLVKNEEALVVTEDEGQDANTISFTVSVSKDEIAKVIGKNGSVIKSIRTLAAIPAKKDGKYLKINLKEV